MSSLYNSYDDDLLASEYGTINTHHKHTTKVKNDSGYKVILTSLIITILVFAFVMFIVSYNVINSKCNVHSKDNCSNSCKWNNDTKTCDVNYWLSVTFGLLITITPTIAMVYFMYKVYSCICYKENTYYDY